MRKDSGFQSTLPETFVTSTPPIRKRRKSYPFSDDTFHQNVMRAGPVTLVWSQLSWLLVMAPLLAAAEPSWVKFVWLIQAAFPPLVQSSVGASTASPKVNTVIEAGPLLTMPS